MALTDGAVLVPGIGHIFTGTVGSATKWALSDLTAFAANTATVPSGWVNLGHTSIDNVLVFGQDGGDTTVKGSWQNASLRTVITSQTIDSFVVKSLQVMDNTILTLYYGGGDVATANEFHWPDSPAAQNKAVTVVMLDGSTPIALWCPQASILRADAADIASDDFMDFPLKFTILKHSTDPRAVWIADLIGA